METRIHAGGRRVQRHFSLFFHRRYHPGFCRISKPVINAVNSSDRNPTVLPSPSGQLKRPRSRRFAHKIRPEPSHHSSLMRLRLLLTKTKTQPDMTSCPNTACTHAESPLKPSRKSTGASATNTRVVGIRFSIVLEFFPEVPQPMRETPPRSVSMSLHRSIGSRQPRGRWQSSRLTSPP